MDLLRNNTTIRNMNFIPARHELRPLAVGEVVMIRVYHLHPVGVLSHPKIILEVFEDDLDHHIAVCLLLGRKPGMNGLQKLTGLGCVVLLVGQSTLSAKQGPVGCTVEAN